MPNGGTRCCACCGHRSAPLRRDARVGSEPSAPSYTCSLRDIELEIPAATYCENYDVSREPIPGESVGVTGPLKVVEYFALQGEAADRLRRVLQSYLEHDCAVSPEHAEVAAGACIARVARNYHLWKIAADAESRAQFGLDRLLLASYCGLGLGTRELLSLDPPSVQEVREICYRHLCRGQD